MRTVRRRLEVCLALAVCLVPFLLLRSADPKPMPKTEVFNGKVVPLGRVLDPLGVKLDPDVAALALVTDDGKVYPLLKDDGARLFFKDERLLNRPMRLTARLHPEVQMLQVLVVNSYVKGELCEVYYWCDVCSIRRPEKGKCDCCGGPLELHEEPVKR
jgi:hypothetical protein